ncbi:MAG: hypothetical protein M1826_004070 [Phylliscum demangeonii]|nr:MAG: hypothetical protein M1826_004070 [Phylliscum demangeonii]
MPDPTQDPLYVDEGDHDSAYDDDSASDTTSLASEVTKYRFENGRRYHAYRDGAYWGPNDEKHNNHLDIAHHLFLKAMDNKLFYAPIGPKPQRILDLGAGTGIWVLDVGDQFPSAQVIGVDLSPTQPSFVPPNVRFEVDDFESPWTYTPNSFDFIHARTILGCVADWPALYQQALHHLKPGGYYEQVELGVEFCCDDGSVKPNSPLAQWGRLFTEAGDKMGKTLMIVNKMKDYMVAAGFEDVHEIRQKWPIGAWSSDEHLKDIGRWNQLHTEEGIDGWALALLTRVMDWPVESVQVYLAKMKTALRERKNHSYFEMSICYGRKPVKEKTTE